MSNRRKILSLTVVILLSVSLHLLWWKHAALLRQRWNISRNQMFHEHSRSNRSEFTTVMSSTTTTIPTPKVDFSLLESEDHLHASKKRIPNIIHQFWDAPGVPAAFSSNIKTWTKLHPSWEYWFWQAGDVRLFIKTCFPDYFLLYERYPFTVNRADAMRYFVLYAFGGLYLDLDMVALKANDDLMRNRTCVLTEETYEHSIIMYENIKQPNLINAYMACHPAHPLFKMAIKDLPKSRFQRDDLRRTGPFFLDHIYRVYNTNLNKTGHGVTVLNAHLVMPTYDGKQLGFLKKKCLTTRNKPAAFNRACQEFKDRAMGNKPFPESYANHLWTHTYMAERRWKTGLSLPIRDIVPNAIDVKQRILQICPRNAI